MLRAGNRFTAAKDTSVVSPGDEDLAGVAVLPHALKRPGDPGAGELRELKGRRPQAGGARVNKPRGPPREATLDDQIHKRREERLRKASCRNEVEPRGRREPLPYRRRDELGVPAARQQGAD